MKKIFLTLAVLMAGALAHAESASFQFSHLVGYYAKSLRTITITPTTDGKLTIASPDGEDTVEPKIIRDARPADGNLELDLGKGRVLVVGSGFTMDGNISYSLKSPTGDTHLSPVVYFNIKK